MPGAPPETDLRTIHPVERIPTDPPGDTSVSGTALCLSGGGYRAMLFHLGALWRLNELGLLSKLDRVSSVSGGSITAALLAVKWPGLGFDKSGVARRFEQELVDPLRQLANRTIDWISVIRGVFGPGTVSFWITRAYRKFLFGRKTLQDLPMAPRFVINATNVQSGVLWRFSKPYAWDYRVGKIENPTIEVATAVAASSAFPPFLSPVALRFKESDFVPGTGLDLQRPPFTTKVVLTDGGVYDNLGLETAWKKYKTILVSDASQKMQAEASPKREWLLETYRVLNLINNEVTSLRKRQLIDSYVQGRRSGTYWGIHSDMANYNTPGSLLCSFEKTTAIANVPTRLKALDPITQERLINWGYAISDAAIRKHLDPFLPPPTGFPFPKADVG